MPEKEWLTATITLATAANPVNISLKVPGWPVKPQVMLPVLQQLANKLANVAEQKAAVAGDAVSCRMGCAACCRQPVPVTEVEVYYLAMIVAQQPEPRRSELRRRFDVAATHFQQMGWLDAYSQCEDAATLKSLIQAYCAEDISCPFLENDACSIYAHRPVVCREFLVTSDPVHCSAETDENVHRLPVTLSLMEGLGQMGRTRYLAGTKSFLPLVFSLAWASQTPESFAEKTGPEWLADFCR